MSRRRICLDGGSALLLKGSPPTSPPLPGPSALLWQNRFASAEEENKNTFLGNEYVSFATSKNPGQKFWQIILPICLNSFEITLKDTKNLEDLGLCFKSEADTEQSHHYRLCPLSSYPSIYPGFKFVFLSLTTVKLMCIGSPLPAMNLAGNC